MMTSRLGKFTRITVARCGEAAPRDGEIHVTQPDAYAHARALVQEVEHVFVTVKCTFRI